MYFRKADFFCKFKALFTIFLRFGREARNYIRCYGNNVKSRTQTVNGVRKLCGRIVPVHCTENIVRAALERKMKMRTERPKIFQPFNIFIVDEYGFERAEAHPFKPFYGIHSFKQVAKAEPSVFLAVTVKVNTCENYLFIAVFYYRDSLFVCLVYIF